MAVKTCAICRIPLTGASVSPQDNLCQNCYNANLEFRFRKTRQFICQTCGQEFIATHQATKYCSIECTCELKDCINT